MTKGTKQLERIVRGFSNHRRIEMLRLLSANPDLDLIGIARLCGVRFRNAAEHTRRLGIAGLIFKQPKGRRVFHRISPRGRQVLEFLQSLR